MLEERGSIRRQCGAGRASNRPAKRSGPAISGALVADREARIRAEISGAVLATTVEQGERVNAGTVLARLDDASVRDAAISARSTVAQATVAAEQSARELQRSKTLAAAGAIAQTASAAPSVFLIVMS